MQPLPAATGAAHGRLYRLSERVFDGMLHLYERTLRHVLAHPAATGMAFILTLVGTGYLFVMIPKGFIPNEDTGQIFAFTEAAQDISFDAMMEKQQVVAAIVRKNPYVQEFFSGIGASGASTVLNTGRIFMRLKPRSERPPAEKIIQEMRPQFAVVPGMNVYPQILPTIRIGGQLTKGLYQYTLQDADLLSLYKWAPILYDRMRKLPGFLGRQHRPPDHEPAGRSSRSTATGPPPSASRRSRSRARSAAPTARLRSRPSTPPPTSTGSSWSSCRSTSATPRRSRCSTSGPATGQLVPLNAVARLSRGIGPLTVNHLGQLPAVTISFNLKPGVALGDAVTEIQKLQRELRLPATLSATFQGTAQAFQAVPPGAGPAAAGGHPRDLPDPGHPVRELHPSADHSLRSALGRGRRAPDARCSSTRS